jgi:hypothetical protein
VIKADFRRPRPRSQVPQRSAVRPEVEHAVEVPARVAAGGGRGEHVLPLNRLPERTVSREQLGELDIPTFIRRQMD